MPLGLRLCTSRDGGTGGGGWVSALGLGSMAASGLGLEKTLVGDFSPPLHKGVEKTVLSPCRASISGSEAFFSVQTGDGRQRAVTIECPLMGGCG